jgi:hypothetical protein
VASDPTISLGPGVHLKNGSYYLVTSFKREDGRRGRNWLNIGRDQEAAAQILTKQGIRDGGTARLPEAIRACFHRAKRNAKVRGMEWAITPDDINHLIARCRGRCEVSGIPLTVSWGGARKKNRPYAPSLDRIDSSKGYTLDNCRIVCVAVNLAMSEWGESVLRRIARAMCRNG